MTDTTVRYARTQVVADRSKPRPLVRASGTPLQVQVTPTRYRANAHPSNPRTVRVLQDVAGVANALSQRLRFIIEEETLGGQRAPRTTGSATEYFLETDGAPVITLFDGISLWLRPHVSNEEGPITLKVDGTPAKPFKVRIGGVPEKMSEGMLRRDTAVLATYDSFNDIWAIGVNISELPPGIEEELDLKLADHIDLRDQSQALVNDAQAKLDEVPELVQQELTAWSDDAESPFGQLETHVQENIYTITGADEAIAGARTELRSEFTDDITQLEASIADDYVTFVDQDEALTALQQTLNSKINDVEAEVNIIAGTRTNTDGEAASGILLEATASGAEGSLEISAFRDAQTGAEMSEIAVAADVFRFSGGMAIFDGVLRSDNYSPGGSDGWELTQAGEAKFNKSLSTAFASIGKFVSASSGERVEIEDDRISVYDENNTLRVRIGRL